MAKYIAQPFVFDADKYRQNHRRLIAGVGGKVADIFAKTAKKIATIGLSTGFNSDTEEFKWSDYPVQQKQAEKAVNGMFRDLVSAIEQSQVAAWDASNLKNDDMVKAILPTTDLPEDIVASFTPRNLEALKAYQERKVAGMNLSQRIWSFKQQSEREFEMALDVALGTGKSADELSRDIRLSLKEPNNLFRRVRDKHGNLVPSKAMKAHIAGRGVYHSSYKNALRVAATETNMAYRHADNTRWRGMPFVLGIEVKTSINNHNPHPDMCDELEGVYPVDFEFVGWHPFCRCWASPKLADRKEMEKYLDDLQDGKDVSDYAFTGRVEDVPQGFKDWVEDNQARIENAASVPYFIRDNYVDGDINKKGKWIKQIYMSEEEFMDIANSMNVTKHQEWVLYESDDLYIDSAWSRTINSELAEAKIGDVIPDDFMDAGSRQQIQTLDEVIAANKTPKDIRVYRRVTPKWLEREGIKFEEGEIVTEYGFTSTSGVEGKNVMGKKKTVRLEIDVPKGSNAFFSKNSDESEIILPRGSKFKVLSVRGEKGEEVIRLRLLTGQELANATKLTAEQERKEWRDRLQAAADKRHAERTTQKVAGIKRRYENLQKQHEAWKNHAEATLQLARKYPNDMDFSTLRDHIASGQFSKMEKEAKSLDKQIAKIEKQMVKVKEVLPFADQYTTTFSIAEMQADAKAVGAKMKWLEKQTLDVQKTFLEAELRNVPNILWERAFKDKLENVVFDIKVRDMGVKLTPLTTYAQKTGLQFYKDLVEAVQSHMNKTEMAFAEAELQLAEEILPLVERYDDLMSYTGAAKKSRYWDILKEVEEGFVNQDITFAETKLQEAEAFRKQSIYNKQMADLRKQRKAKESAEAAAKAKEAEAAAKATMETEDGYDVLKDDFFTPERSIADAKSISDVKEIMGDELPVLLQKYEQSIARESLTSAEYLAERKEIERKLKEFFDAHDFGHWEHPELLDERILDGGFLTNLQATAIGVGKGRDYDRSRAGWGHWGYGLQGSKNKVPEAKMLRDGDYYRCGVPISKDKLRGVHEIGFDDFYGRSQVRFRKDRLLTTFTARNSLGSNCVPSLTCDPKVVSLDKVMMQNIDAASYTSMRQLKGSFSNYMEIQYLPRASTERIMPRDVESIVLERHPLDYHPKRIWDRWKKEGVDIYYYDKKQDKVVLYQKGDPIFDEITDPKEIAKAKQGAEFMLKNLKNYINADLEKSEFDTLKEAMKKAEYGQAKAEVQRLKGKILAQRKELAELTDIIPDAAGLHKDFTLEELKAAREAVKKKFEYLEGKTAGNIDKYLDKLEFEVRWLEDPAHQKHRTWQIARDAYQRKAVEVRREIKKRDMTIEIAKLKKKATKDRAFTGSLSEAEALLQAGKIEEAAAKLKEATDYLASIGQAVEEHLQKLGEALGVKFNKKELEKARKDAMALITNHEDPQQAFNAADEIMSKYAEDIWKRLTREEREVAYLYTSGSRYINEPLFGRYYGGDKFDLDGKLISNKGREHANILTSIIEKAKPLENPMWVEHTEDFNAFLGRFGIDLRRMSEAEAQQFLGTEAVNLPFTSTSCAADSLFTKLESAALRREIGYNGTPPTIRMQILLPKGTKGLYCEPFAQWGDGKIYKNKKHRYGDAAVNWDGKSRLDAGHNAGDQVEFLLQRGSKFRIKGIKKIGTTWNVEVELIEQVPLKPV